MPRSPSVIQSRQPFPHVGTDGESDDGDDVGDEDDIDNNKIIPSYAYSTLSFQKRQALGNNVTPKNITCNDWVLGHFLLIAYRDFSVFGSDG